MLGLSVLIAGVVMIAVISLITIIVLYDRIFK